MRVLFDECAPKRLKSVLKSNGFDCKTVQESGWAGKENGELLSLAETQFEATVTVDQKMRYQQRMTGRRIAMVVLRGRTTRLVDLEKQFDACVQTLRSIRPGMVVELGPGS